MRHIVIWGAVTASIGAAVALALNAAEILPPPLAAPKLVPVAETKLLMDGLAQPNFRGLEKLLKEKPADVEAWVFARGQALLIAETGNLLMLRPPRSPAEKIWLDRAGDLRTTATSLARQLAGRDFEKSRKALGVLANSCNACHHTFKVKTRIVAFAESEKTQEK
jgi:cytochrome c556